MRKRYTLGMAIFDIFMTLITSGLWLVWLLIKYLRTH